MGSHFQSLTFGILPEKGRHNKVLYLILALLTISQLQSELLSFDDGGHFKKDKDSEILSSKICPRSRSRCARTCKYLSTGLQCRILMSC